jgi:hypothetical protein
MSDTSLAYRLGQIDLGQVRKLNALKSLDRLKYAFELRRLGASRKQLVEKYGSKAVKEAQRTQSVRTRDSR